MKRNKLLFGWRQVDLKRMDLQSNLRCRRQHLMHCRYLFGHCCMLNRCVYVAVLIVMLVTLSVMPLRESKQWDKVDF